MRIMVAMSGGVDSSVAAALLARDGHEVLGVTLQLWGKDVCVTAGTRLCCSVRDALDAKAVARRLGIAHHTLELVEEFRERVIDYFVDSYAHGLTPNPCIACNDHIKFGSLLRHADLLGADAIATGHYARVHYDAARGRAVLRRAADPSKDQSYVLFGLTQPQLARSRFPLGELSKPQVRELAHELGLVTADKPDSQDICFVRDRDKDGFLRRVLNVEEVPGPITLTDGTVVGSHRGLLGYTIGQREGLGLAMGYPVYVVGFDRPANRLIIGTREQLLQRAAVVDRVNWASIAAPGGPVHAAVKIRSRHQPAEAVIAPRADGRWTIEFVLPQESVTPGQAAVFYDGDEVLGGGYLCAAPSDLADAHPVALREGSDG
jgi:tRNA-specific 2-thiouridylase